METIASVLIIGVTALAAWKYTGQDGYRNRLLARVIVGAALLYLIIRLF